MTWMLGQGYEGEKVVAYGGEASVLTLVAASVETRFPNVQLNGMLRTLREAPGMGGQVRYTAWVPGLALVTDVPQLLKGLRDRVTVKSWLKPGAEKPREGYT